MSAPGQSPAVKRIRYTPQGDPVNPQEGDFYYSNGDDRAVGPWVYQDGDWQQVSTSGSLATVNDITFTPQSSDPSSPSTGMVFYSDGTTRTAGLWIYNGTGWVQLSQTSRSQEFYVKDYVQVRAATTANITLVSQLENGDSLDGLTLATGDKVLVKNQTTATENGVYVVQVSGAPVRDTSADTFSELNYYAAIVNDGTTNRNTQWFQTAVLTSLSDNQTWATTPATRSFTVPTGVERIRIKGCGAGGSGGAAGGRNTGSGGNRVSGGGGGGGSGGGIVIQEIAVTPGETLTITLGKGGARVAGVITGTAPSGNNGTSTTIAGSFGTLTCPGGEAGTGGTSANGASNGVGGAGGDTSVPDIAGAMQADGGTGGNGTTSSSDTGDNGQSTSLKSGGTGGASGDGGGGGGGGAGIVAGAVGGRGDINNSFSITTPMSDLAGGDGGNKGAGGGGGGGQGGNINANRVGGTSGAGGCGYVEIAW